MARPGLRATEEMLVRSRLPGALLALILSATGHAQQVTGSLEGTVLDEKGTPIPDVQVVASSSSLQGTRGGVTTSAGYFRLTWLPVGTYRVEFSHVGYQNVVLEDAVVRLGRTTGLREIRLAVHVHEMPPVTVSGARPLIDPSSTTVGANFTSRDYAALPTERDYRSMAVLVPQVNESFLGDSENFAGSTGSENKYFMDGVETTDPHRGLTGMTLPSNFVEEIHVRVGGSEAEYRSSLGGGVDVITFSGGNEFHGQIFGFLSSNRLADEPKRVSWEPTSGDHASYDVGFSLGGPILRDRLWFFAAYDPSIETEDVEIPGHGHFEDRSTIHRFATKLTWRPAEHTNAVFTLVGDPADRRAVSSTLATVVANPDPLLSDQQYGGYVVSLRGAHQVSDALLINATVSRHYDILCREAGTKRGQEEIYFHDHETDVLSGGGRSRLDDLGVRSTVGASATLVVESHIAKAGLEYLESRLAFDNTWRALHRYSDPLFNLNEWEADGTVANRVPSAYIQDSWRLGERFRLNAGLRWDGQFLVGSDGKVAQRITDQWQPRLGFTYQPGELGSQKVCGSYGRFYQELSTSVVNSHYVEDIIDQRTRFDHDPRHDPSGGEARVYAYGIQPEVPGMEGQHYDAFTLGYERELHMGARLGICGLYRRMGQALEDGFDPETGDYELNNPGRGALGHGPRARHEYSALEVTFQKSGGTRYGLLVSYALSRTHGNYAGLYGHEANQSYPNNTYVFDLPAYMENSTGLLPNDRTHVFKCSGFCRVGGGLSAGGSFWWMSGTPLSEWGGSEYGPPVLKFIGKRGGAGRTPAIWNLNLRFTYELPVLGHHRLRPRLILDLFHVGSPRTAVDFDQFHYLALDEEGNQAMPNETYGQAMAYQPPMALRLGMELDF
jgi:hypothetical protein